MLAQILYIPNSNWVQHETTKMCGNFLAEKWASKEPFKLYTSKVKTRNNQTVYIIQENSLREQFAT